MSEAKKTQLGRFELRKELGRGFHGRVFLAWDPQLEREVAIKWLLGARQSDDASRAQFMTEARAVARLAHPNIIPLYEVGMHGKIPFLVFEYVQGIPLKQEILQRERIPEAEADHPRVLAPPPAPAAQSAQGAPQRRAEGRRRPPVRSTQQTQRG